MEKVCCFCLQMRKLCEQYNSSILNHSQKNNNISYSISNRLNYKHFLGIIILVVYPVLLSLYYRGMYMFIQIMYTYKETNK